MRIAVIDDGINPNLLNIGKLLFDINLTDDNTDPEIYSHGTLCAAVIKKYAHDAQIGSIRVLNKNDNRGSIKNLVKAIEWCAENKIEIIHMSIGSSEITDKGKLQRAVNNGITKGCIFVAALSNRNSWSYPACFTGVIGVMSNPSLKDDQYIKSEHENIDYETGSVHSAVLSEELIIETQQSNSYAAPVITSQIIRLCETTKDRRPGNISNILSRNIGQDETQKNRFADFYTDENNTNILTRNISEERLRKLVDSRITGVIFNGILDERQYKTLAESGVLVWDRSHIRRRDERETLKELEIPVISVKGDTKQALSFGKRLCEELFGNDYPCLCVTDRIDGVRYGFEILENET